MAYKQSDWKETYCEPTAGNIRYPSSAPGTYEGWAYVFTQDHDYADDLAHNHAVEIRTRDGWRHFISGSDQLPTQEDLDDFNTPPTPVDDYDGYDLIDD